MLFRAILVGLAVSLEIPAASGAIGWSTETGWGKKHVLFPAAIIALAPTKVSTSPFYVRMSDVPAGTRVRIVVTCRRLFSTATRRFTTKRPLKRLESQINVAWKFNRLDHINQQIPVEVMYHVYVNGQRLGSHADVVDVHSINACPYFVYGKVHGKLVSADLRCLFAGYVNENAPVLDDILKKALKTGAVKQFVGYQNSNPEQVIRQVYAIWLALAQQGIKYSNIANPPVDPSGIDYQHVRFVDQSFAAAQANCVDGSVLFASLLEHIGIDCGLVMKSGHMFLIFYAAPHDKVPVCLETTMIGSRSQINPQIMNPLKGMFHWWEFRAHPFEAAVQYGDFEFNQLVAQQKKLAGTGNRVFWVIRIAAERKIGILPIPDPNEGNR